MKFLEWNVELNFSNVHQTFNCKLKKHKWRKDSSELAVIFFIEFFLFLTQKILISSHSFPFNSYETNSTIKHI